MVFSDGNRYNRDKEIVILSSEGGIPMTTHKIITIGRQFGSGGHEIGQKLAKELGIKVINEVEMAYSFLDKSVNIIGVTGSNGKTTTTTLISEFMKNSFDNVYLGGNIGIPLSNFVRDIKSNSYLVLEISDHQLCDMYDFKTNVSVLTNITPTHLDFHKSYEVYQMTKKKIFNNVSSFPHNFITKSFQMVKQKTQRILSQSIQF